MPTDLGRPLKNLLKQHNNHDGGGDDCAQTRVVVAKAFLGRQHTLKGGWLTIRSRNMENEKRNHTRPTTTLV